MTATPFAYRRSRSERTARKTFKSKLTKHDRRLFRGTAVEVFPDTTDEGILSSAHANFDVLTTPVQFTTDHGMQTSADKLVWYRNDNSQQLGVFGLDALLSSR